MKKLLLVFSFIITTTYIYSQNVGIGNNNPQSKLHVAGAIRSDTLVGIGPRHLFAASNGRIYDSALAVSPLYWRLNGNNNVTATNFLGTTNAFDLIFRTNNNEVARFTPAGKFGIGTNAPNASAFTEITSTTGGLLIPRMTTLQRIAIPAPAMGLLVYDITANCLFHYNSATTSWQSFCTPGLGAGTNDVSGTYPALTVVGLQTTPVAITTPTTGQILQFNGTSWTPTSGTFWNLLGNAGTNPTINFLGTTDNTDLAFRTNNTEYARFQANGIFHNMQGTLINTLGANGQGANFSAGGGSSLSWRLNDAGYTGIFYNEGASINAGGLAVKILATGASNTILDVSTGVQGAAGTPVLTAKGNGNVGVGTNTPNAKLQVILTNNLTASPIASFSRVGTGSLGWLSFFSGATVADYNAITSNGDKSIIFTNDNDPSTTDVSGLVIAPWTTAGNPNHFAGLKIMENGNVGVGTPLPRGKFDVLNGDAYVADNAYPQNSFNVGRSVTSIYADNIRPFTDNGFRVYDGNSNSHLRLEALGQCQIQAYTTTGSTPQLLETPGTEGILSLNPTGGGVRVGIPNGLSPTINPPLADNPIHRLTVGSGYFVAGNFNSGNGAGDHPGTTWISGVGGLAVGMNRNSGRSHVDLWNTSDVTQAAANTDIDRGFEFRGYDNAYAQRTMARIDGIGQFFSNGTFAISDKRFKENIKPFNDKVLDKLIQIKTYNYTMYQPVTKDNSTLVKGSIVKENDFGVIVQELYELFPTVVYKPKDENKETWSVDYSRLSLYYLQGIKEQQEIISAQKTEIDILKQNYAELLNRITKLENK